MMSVHAHRYLVSKQLTGAVTLCALLAGLTEAVAQGQPAAADGAGDRPVFHLQVGARYWSAQWDTTRFAERVFEPAVGTTDPIVGVELPATWRLPAQGTWIPTLGLRYGALFASASAMPATSYSSDYDRFAVPTVSRFKRQERDFNLGYLFDAGVSVSLGHKKIVQHAETALFVSQQAKWQGPVLGLGANAPLGAGFGLYTNVGWGRFKAHFPVSDITGKRDYDSTYGLGDIGVAYAIQAPLIGASSVVVTAGYRSQRFSTQGFALRARTIGTATPQYVFFATTRLQETTQGFVLGAQALF